MYTLVTRECEKTAPANVAIVAASNYAEAAVALVENKRVNLMCVGNNNLLFIISISI